MSWPGPRSRRTAGSSVSCPTPQQTPCWEARHPPCSRVPNPRSRKASAASKHLLPQLLMETRADDDISEGPAHARDKLETWFDPGGECAERRVMGKGSPCPKCNTTHGLDPDTCSLWLQSFCNEKKNSAQNTPDVCVTCYQLSLMTLIM